MAREDADERVRSIRQRREAAAAERAAWAAELEQALAESGLSRYAAATRAGIHPSVLVDWLRAATDPDPRALVPLGEVTGRSALLQAQLLGYIETTSGNPSALRKQAVTEIREAIQSARRWVHAADEALSLTGGGLVAATVTNQTSEWIINVRPRRRGTRFSARYNTHIAFEWNLQISPNEPSAATQRQAIEGAAHDVLYLTGTIWRGRHLSESDWPDVHNPSLVLSAPDFLATRPRGVRPNLAVPPSVCVVSLPNAGGPDIASLVASALDWSFETVALAARDEFRLPLSIEEHEDAHWVRAQAEVARRLLAHPQADGRFLVWSYNALRPIRETFQLCQTELPLVIFIRVARDQLQPLAARMEDASAKDLATAQTEVENVLTGRQPDSYTIIDIDLSPALTPPGKGDIFDNYVDTASAAARWLVENHDGPEFELANPFPALLRPEPTET